MNQSLLVRFDGDDGRRRLIEALRTQWLCQGNDELATRLAEYATLREFTGGSTLIFQDASDNHVILILSGKCTVLVNGRVVAHREAGQHVGEMALIDVSARRSASVVADVDMVVAEVSESNFSKLADEHPLLWRRLAIELSSRLRQRNALVAQRRNQPVLFVGSSTETLPIANEIQTGLRHDPITVTVWTNDVFGPSQVPIEGLEGQLASSDFAVIVIGPEDRVVSRAVAYQAPRDNVVFEIGLFMGGLGRSRAFLVRPRGQDVKIHTDLLGVIAIEYADGPPDTLSQRLAPVCNDLRKIVAKVGPR